ncbi:hypothetical protein J2W30_003687 [Variovorax boronicumulans]|uniref:hypothetical protein n=1 Tax=Variovorax boronicumulans TaxID=436515 RepID=UPI002784B69A|nr:hypothetical protein [Variovorax boronicumulans]MDQ0035914.1 hypothetical protein [Variovorax boronicumulans]
MARKDISDLQCCQAALEYQHGPRGGGRTLEHLMRATGQPEKVCERALERAYDRQFLEWGVSVATCYLRAKGRKLLEENGCITPSAVP